MLLNNYFKFKYNQFDPSKIINAIERSSSCDSVTCTFLTPSFYKIISFSSIDFTNGFPWEYKVK